MLEVDAAAPAADERVFVASQWQLVWWRFRGHKMAVAGAVVVLLFYLIGAFAEFLASADPRQSNADFAFMQPQRIYWFDGGLRPFQYAIEGSRDPATLQKIYVQDQSRKQPLRFFARGFEYRLFGLFRVSRHLVLVEDGDAVRAPFLLGTDKLGRDQLARILYGTRTSLTIGLAGVALSLLLGVVFGGLSGYYGGLLDTVIQRIIEVTRSIPTIPLWIGLAAAVPRDWSVVRLYFAITIIISLFLWTDLGRVVRGRFLALRQEDFVTAARLIGASDARVIFRHMVPYFSSHLIASVTLAIPFMIISETALSFLGLGLRPPAISWGVLLQAAQNVQTVALYWWLTLPAIPVTVAVLAFNFLGDGLRDAADPYG